MSATMDGADLTQRVVEQRGELALGDAADACVPVQGLGDDGVPTSP